MKQYEACSYKFILLGSSVIVTDSTDKIRYFLQKNAADNEEWVMAYTSKGKRKVCKPNYRSHNKSKETYDIFFIVTLVQKDLLSWLRLVFVQIPR